MDSIELRNGRRLDVRTSGPEDGAVLVLFHGTPGSAVIDRSVAKPAQERGLRVVSWSRPGYGDSTRQPGRRVVDIVSDTAEVLTALDVESCVVGGGSSGGPHSLACAARLDSAKAALVVASHGPFQAEGLDFLAGMGEDNIAEYGAALKGEAALRTHLEEGREQLLDVTLDQLMQALSSMLPDVDRSALTDEFGEDVIDGLQEALRNGVDGWLDDDLSFISPWGFELDEIAIPTMIWHGSEDLFNPFSHGKWLAEHIPGAAAHLHDGEGHLSLWQTFPTMLDQLLASQDANRDTPTPAP